MVDAVRLRFPTLNAQLRQMDGEFPDLPPESLDLIVSNLAVQWFENLPEALTRLGQCLKTKGRMVISTLGAGSLVQWKQAVSTIGHQAGTPDYPTADHLAALMPDAKVTGQILTMSYGNAGEFLKSLRSIGATVPAKGYRPLPTPILRQAMAQLGAPCQIAYEILTLDWTKP
jgi:malonyl-CoA O-methyltransferase